MAYKIIEKNTVTQCNLQEEFQLLFSIRESKTKNGITIVGRDKNHQQKEIKLLIK